METVTVTAAAATTAAAAAAAAIAEAATPEAATAAAGKKSGSVGTHNRDARDSTARVETAADAEAVAMAVLESQVA